MIPLLAEHEGFLRAIFDAPDQDTPRLVYADFLEENGDADRAALIRDQVERARLRRSSESGVAGLPRVPRAANGDVRVTLVPAWEPRAMDRFDRGFPPPAHTVRIAAADLNDPDRFRETAVQKHPEWFGAVELELTRGSITSAEPFRTMFGVLAFANVNRLDLRGHARWQCQRNTDNPVMVSVSAAMVHESSVTADGLRALAACPEAARLTSLNLTQNRLGDEAVGPLFESPYLANIQRLELHAGNRLGQGTWDRLVQRFGLEVVV